MAYIHKNTFDIYASNSISNPDDYFEADELIALPVQILNRKGYITISCCAGHPFLHSVAIARDSAIIEEIRKFENFSGTKIMSSDGIVKTGENTPIQASCDHSHIAFEKGIFLPNLPTKFGIDEKIDNVCIVKRYDDNNIYRITRDILESMEQLYEWALNLPEFKDYNR